MQRILLLIVITFSFIVSKGQSTLPFPLPQSIGNDSTLLNVHNAKSNTYIFIPFSDTTSANTSHAGFYNSALISTNNGLLLWERYNGAWLPIATGSIPSVFNPIPGYGMLLTGSYPNITFKVDSTLLMPKTDSQYLFITPFYLASKGYGTVSNVAVTNGNGITASVSNPATTPNITIAIEASTYNSIFNSVDSIYVNTSTGDSLRYLRNSGINYGLSIYDVAANDNRYAFKSIVGSVTSVTGNAPLSFTNSTTTPVGSIDTTTRAHGLTTIATTSNDSAIIMAAVNGKGTGSVTSFSVVTANGVSATVANPTTTPAATFTLGNITPTTIVTNSLNFLKQYSLTPAPAHGNVLFDSVGGEYNRDSAWKTQAISKFLIPANTTVRDSIPNESGIYLLRNDSNIFYPYSNPRNYAQVQTYLGILYTNSNFTTTSDFHASGATISASGGVLNISGGSGGFSATADLIADTNSLEHSNGILKYTVNSAPSASAAGVGFGLKSIGGFQGVTAYVDLSSNATAGEIIIKGGVGNTTTIASSPANATIALGDTILYRFKRIADTIRASYTDLTTGNGQSIQYVYSNAYPQTIISPSTCVFSLFAIGGSQGIDSLVISSDEVKNANLLIFGNSKVNYYQGTFANRYGAQLRAYYQNTDLICGPSDQTAQLIHQLPILKLLSPKSVFLSDITCNDQRASVPSSTYDTNFVRIYDSLTSWGIKVYAGTFAETTLDQTAQNTWLTTNFPSIAIPTFFCFGKNKTNCLVADGVHPSPMGADSIFNCIYNSYLIGGSTYAINSNSPYIWSGDGTNVSIGISPNTVITVNNTTDQVGINQSSPSATLTVQSAIPAGGVTNVKIGNAAVASQPVMILQADSTNNILTIDSRNNQTIQYLTNSLYRGAMTNGGVFEWGALAGTGMTYIDVAGQIGINTIPSANVPFALQSCPTCGGNSIMKVGNAGLASQPLIFIQADSTAAANEFVGIDSRNNFPMDFFVNNTQAGTFLTNGTFGIGTSATTPQFQVNNAGRITMENNTAGANGTIFIGSSSGWLPANITGSNGVVVTNGANTIALSLDTTFAATKTYVASGTATPTILSVVTGINAKSTGSTTLYTVPAGKTAVITQAIIRCTAASSITNGPTVNIQTVSTGDIYAGVAINALTTAGQDFGFVTNGMSVTAAAAGTITLNVTGASTGTSQTISITLIGYLQ